MDAPGGSGQTPRLTVVGTGEQRPASGMRALLVDGTVAIAVGGAVAGGFFVETVKSFAAAEPAGRWWIVGVFVLGLASLATGLWQRGRRIVRVGIVATAVDLRRGEARAQRLQEQAESFSRAACTVTLRARVELPAGQTWARESIDDLAEQTVTAAALAERLSPEAAQIALIPTMPLHVGFRFGALLGHTHARDVVVHSIRQADGTPAYFPAISLRAPDSKTTVLDVGQLEQVPDGSPARAALAVDLQGRGAQFFEPVLATCRQQRIGWLLCISTTHERLAENQETFTAAVEQIRRAWLDVGLPAPARTGRHAIFLSGPVAIAVALGARLAAPEHGRWTAYTFDPDTSAYEPFPAETPLGGSLNVPGTAAAPGGSDGVSPAELPAGPDVGGRDS